MLYHTPKSNQIARWDRTTFQLDTDTTSTNFQLSFKLGSVPDHLKLGCITPIYQSGDKTLLLHYVPITLLN